MFLPCSASRLTRAVAMTATATRTSSSVNPLECERACKVLAPLGDFGSATDWVDAQRIGVSFLIDETDYGTIRVALGIEARRHQSLLELADPWHEHVGDPHVRREGDPPREQVGIFDEHTRALFRVRHPVFLPVEVEIERQDRAPKGGLLVEIAGGVGESSRSGGQL